METNGCSQQWKMHRPEFASKTKNERDGGGPQKNVTMAPTSRYLSGRHYVMRKPLFSSEQHISILKKTHPQKHLQMEKHLSVCRTEKDQQYANISLLTRAEKRREKLTPESFSLSHCDLSPHSASTEELGSPLGVADFRGRLSHEELTVSSFPGRRSAQRSLSSSILEAQRPNPPLRPQLTSTVLYPTYTPCSSDSRWGQTDLRLGRGEQGGAGETKLNTCSSVRQSRGRTMSSCQANYWACAIPKTLPQSPDRHSVGWDPNKEYKALLDYAYPLRPGQQVSDFEVRGDCPLQTDPNLQDSGIELDPLCSSTNLLGFDYSLSPTWRAREGGLLSVCQRSPEMWEFSKSLDGLPSGAPLLLTHLAGLSSESLVYSTDRDEMKHYSSGSRHHQLHTPSSFTSTAFIHSTSVLPHSSCVGVEVDEEFQLLPERLEEMQLLSIQVREVTAQLGETVTASWESLEPGTTSILSSISLPEKQEAEEEKEVKEQEGSQVIDERNREERIAAETADYGDSEAVRKSPKAWLESVGGGLSQASLKEMEALVEQLCCLTLPDTQRSSQEDQEQSVSLMQRIQIFCSHLGQLIQWLYTVSEKMNLLDAPTMDIESLKSSLAEYQSFQKEVSNHQKLTACVLHSGQLLLTCVNTTSPVLRDTLLLIEKQSRALESHREHFFSSIQAAMDSLAQPSKVEDLDPMGLQRSTL